VAARGAGPRVPLTSYPDRPLTPEEAEALRQQMEAIHKQDMAREEQEEARRRQQEQE